MINDILSKHNIDTAMEHLLQKKDSVGIDGMSLSALPEYLKNNQETLKKTILSGNYSPGLIQALDIVNNRGEVRTISKLTAPDRLVLRLIYQILYARVSPKFSPFSFGYMENRSTVGAVRRAADHADEGFTSVIEVDIDNFFDNVPHHRLVELLKKHELDDITLGLIKKFLVCGVVKDFEIQTPTKGLIQGSPLSPLLSNIYLNELDALLTEKEYRFCRFADDVRIFAKTFEEGLVIFGEVKAFIENELDLTLQSQKCGIFNIFDRSFLGYSFNKFPNGKVEIRKKIRNKKVNFFTWRTTAIQRVNSDYHLIADGILTQKDYTLLFENPDKKMYFPVECIDSINLYSNIIFSSDFFRFAAEKGLQINMFDKFGEYVGMFTPKKLASATVVFLGQALSYEDIDQRLELAKQFALSAAHNIRENLRYYARHTDSKLIKRSITDITDLIAKEKRADDTQSLRLIEAHVRAKYYTCMNDILPYDSFRFTKRTKRPPQDALNALISFGNTILYRRIAKEIYKSRLDIRIGFLHAANRRAESLNLDVAEIFRPIIVDRVIFSLINRHMLSEQSHFETFSNSAVYLNKEGKKIFIDAFDKKIYSRVTLGGLSVSYGELIKIELQKLTRRFEKGDKYKAYKYFL